MTTGQLILLDHAVALLSIAAWLGAGVTAARWRIRVALALLVAALLVTLTRVATSVVVLLTAAYAALAGLVVTFLVGYPLTWSAALIAISLVCAGALLTARVLATPVENTPVGNTHDHTGISRRRFIGLTGGAIVAGTAGTGVGLSFLSPEPVTTGGGPGPSSRASVPVTELRGAGAPAPGGALRQHVLTALVVTPRDAAAEQLDLTLPVHTFDGTVVIADQDGRTEHTAPAGTPVRLRLTNTDSDPQRFALAGMPFRVAAVDGRDLNQPGEVTGVGLRLAAGGRYDLLFTMPDTPVALVLDDDRERGLWLRPDDSDELSIEDIDDWSELDLLRYGTPAPVPFDGRPLWMDSFDVRLERCGKSRSRCCTSATTASPEFTKKDMRRTIENRDLQY